MLKKLAFSPLMLSLLILVFAASAFSQTTAKILGTVSDQSGAAVVGAKVIVKNPALGIERTTQTNSIGAYEVAALPPGTYSVQVEMNGFETQLAKNIVADISNNVVQNFGLKVASTSEVVTVEATAPLIESTTMTVGATINQRTVQELPLNGRHFVDLALLIPGTVTAPQNGFLTAPLRGQGAFAVNTAGMREDAVNWMVNGINLNDMAQNQVTFQPTINTVSEFKVDNSTYSAEYGRNAGAIVTIASRSGSNQFHGELYDYVRNNVFDARNAFNPVTQPQSPFKRNQFGGDFGGPIFKDKTFFFATYEGERHRQGLNTSALVFNQTQIAQIAASTNPVVKSLAALVPAANGTLNGSPAFFGSATAPVNIDQGTIDIQHNFSDHDRLHGYYVNQHDLRQEPTQGANIPGFGDTRAGIRQVFTLGESHVLNSSMVNELNLGVNRILITFTPNNLTDPNSLGLGTTLGPNEAFMPTIAITGGPTFGDERTFPQGRGDTTAVIADNFSYVRGRHSFKFGTEFRDFKNSNFNGDPGQLVFNSVANFINGTADSSARTIGNVANRINVGALDFYGMDSFKVKPYLTVELGLRYGWNMTPSEGANRFVNFVPGGAFGSTLEPTTEPYSQQNKNFQPRVGFAWDVFHDGKTILRSGYAYQIDQPITGVVTGLTSNPPFALPISIATQQTFAALPALFNGTPSSVAPIFVNPNFKNADVQSWNLNIQQQLTRNSSAMIGYFGNKGTHLENDINANQTAVLGQVGTGATNVNLPFQRLSPNSPFLPGVPLAASITERESGSNSIYNALWATYTQKVTNGLQLNASYTYSHSIDDVSRNDAGIQVQNSNDIFLSRGSSDFDARHRIVANAIYDLPFKGNRVVSGWEIAPVVQWQTGNPFNLVAFNSSSFNGVGSTITLNASGPIHTSGNPLGQWISNPGVLSVPCTLTTTNLTSKTVTPTCVPGTLTFGNVGRNSVYGPGFTNMDLALVKNTKISERLNLQLRADAFDVLNHPNYGQPGASGGFLAASLQPAFAANPGNQFGSFSTIGSTRFPTGDSG
ncbi:MAG TPA: carboxypeptidase-like regulatory domain-containing protein, partial [Candidatus Angelobacter sp.]|nr:carboxypeptidase-like regulatory domain-containing protein [Candidatus Angelobacter sp.]